MARRLLEFADAWWGKMAEAGRCSAPEMFHAPGGLNTWMVTGDEAEFHTLVAEAGDLLALGRVLGLNWRWEVMMTGDAVEAFYGRWAASLEKVGAL